MSRFERGGEGSNPSEATIIRIYKKDDVRHSHTGCRIYTVHNLDILPSDKRDKGGRERRQNVPSRFF